MERLFTLQQLEQAFNDGERHRCDELEIPIGDAYTYFEAWMQLTHPEEGYKILKTSAEWQEFHAFIVVDPDGWDRQNYQYSWFEETITWGEFKRRMFRSTHIARWDKPKKDGK